MQLVQLSVVTEDTENTEDTGVVRTEGTETLFNQDTGVTEGTKDTFKISISLNLGDKNQWGPAPHKYSVCSSYVVHRASYKQTFQ